MPSYEYRCPRCGIVEKYHAMGSAPHTDACPGCGRDAKRIFSPPLLNQTPRPLVTARERADKSADTPDVVHRERKDGDRPSAGPTNPALQKLVGKEAARRLQVGRHPARPADRR